MRQRHEIQGKKQFLEIYACRESLSGSSWIASFLVLQMHDSEHQLIRNIVNKTQGNGGVENSVHLICKLGDFDAKTLDSLYAYQSLNTNT